MKQPKACETIFFFFIICLKTIERVFASAIDLMANVPGLSAKNRNTVTPPDGTAMVSFKGAECKFLTI